MPSTPKRQLPYPSGSDKIGKANEAIQALAEKLDTPWEGRSNIAGLLAAGFTVTAGGVFDIRRNGQDREVRGSITAAANFGANATATIATGLPAADRPSQNAFNSAYMTSARAGMAFVRPNGEVAVTNFDTTARATAQFTIKYTVE